MTKEREKKEIENRLTKERKLEEGKKSVKKKLKSIFFVKS